MAEFHRFRPARIITVGEILLAYPLRLPAARNRDLPDVFPDSVAPPEILIQLILQVARFERVPERGKIPFPAQRNPISVIRLNRRVYDCKMRLAPRPSIGCQREFRTVGINGSEKTDYVIDSASVNDIVATGKDLFPTATVKAGGKTLTQNVDYVVVTDTLAPGTATATIKGIGL